MKNDINHVTIFITADCNLRCSYCFVKEKPEGVCSFTNIKTAVEVLHNTKGIKTISLFGGEPLIYHEFLTECIEYIYQFDPQIHIGITTNGTLLNEVIFKILENYKVSITLSIDGIGEKSNSSRKRIDGKSSWKLIEENILNIGTEKIDLVRMTVNVKNVKNLSDRIIEIFQYGFKCIDFAIDYSDNWTLEYMTYYENEFVKILEWYSERYKDEFKYKILNIDKWIFNALNQKTIRCSYGRFSIAIGVNGDIYRCHREVYDDDFKPIGNISNINIIDNCRFHVNDNICQICDLFKRCEFCAINIKINKGSDNNIPDVICLFNKIHIFNVDKIIDKYIKK